MDEKRTFYFSKDFNDEKELCIFTFRVGEPKHIDFEFVNDDSFATTLVYEYEDNSLGLIHKNFGESLNLFAINGGIIYLIFDQKALDRLIFEVQV